MTTRVLLPDRELDALAAEKVMGWKVVDTGEFRPRQFFRVVNDKGEPLTLSHYSAERAKERAYPSFTESLDAALLLVEALRAKGWTISLLLVGDAWHWQFWRIGPDGVGEDANSDDLVLARSITIAALLAVGASPYGGEEARDGS